LEIFEAINGRSSVRWFKPDSVPDYVLMRLLNAAIRAPTAMAMEQWYFIVVKSDEMRKKVHDLLMEAHTFYYAQANIRSLDTSRIQELHKRFSQGMYRAPVYIVAYLDLRAQALKEEYRELEELFGVETVSAALENIALTAVSLGLGTCWIGVTNFIEKKLNAILNPPDGCKLIALMPLGYPTEEVKPRSRKKTLEAVTKII